MERASIVTLCLSVGLCVGARGAEPVAASAAAPVATAPTPTPANAPVPAPVGTAAAVVPVTASDPAAGVLVRVETTAGDVIRGTLVLADVQYVVVRNAALGELRVGREHVKVMAAESSGQPAGEPVPAGGGPPPANASPAKLSVAQPVPPPPPAPPAPTPPPAPPPAPQPGPPVAAAEPEWHGSFGVAFNGLAGAVHDSQGVRADFNARRDTLPGEGLDFKTTYTGSWTDGDETQNDLYAEGKYHWTIFPPDSLLFFQMSVERNGIQDYDLRLASSLTLGYMIYKDDKARILVRGGLGLSHKFGSQDERVVPEAVAGGEASYLVVAGVKLYANSETFVATSLLSDRSTRARSSGGIEFVIDEAHKVTLRLGVEHIYDDSLAGRRQDDLQYFARVGFAF